MVRWCGGDDRAQSLQVGLAVTFALLVTAAGIYATTVVPNRNARAEMEHAETVDRDLQQLRTAMVTARSTGRARSAVVDLGLDYGGPFGSMFPPSSGALRTGAGGDIALLDNTGSPQLPLETYCGDLNRDGDADDPTVGTRTVVYDPDYGFQDTGGVTHIGNSVKFRLFDDGGVTVGSDQTVVDGSDIRLAPVQGSLSRTATGTVSVDIRGGSRGGTRFTPDQKVTLLLPSELPVDQWERLLAEERVSNGGHVEQVAAGPGDRVAITLESDVTYELSCRSLGLNEGPPDGGINRLDDDTFGIEDSYLDQGRNADVLLTDVRQGSCPGSGQKCVLLELDNRNGFDVSATRARVAAFNSGPKAEVAELDLEGTTLETYGPFTTLNPAADLPDGTTTTLDVHGFTDEDGDSVQNLKFQFFILTVIYERSDTGERFSATYFVAVPQ